MLLCSGSAGFLHDNPANKNGSEIDIIETHLPMIHPFSKPLITIVSPRLAFLSKPCEKQFDSKNILDKSSLADIIFLRLLAKERLEVIKRK